MANVTIELDIKEEEWDDFELVSTKLVDDLDDIIIDAPILLSQVHPEFPQNFRIRNLSDEIRSLLTLNLDVPPTVTMGSWEMVANFLYANECYEFEGSPDDGKDPWKPFENMHAQVLINALHNVQRIDILVKLQEMIEAECYRQEDRDTQTIIELTTVREFRPTSTFSTVTESSSFPTAPIPDSSAAKNIILVLHYEKTEEETKNFKWFMKNLKANLKNDETTSLTPLLVEHLEKLGYGNNFHAIERTYRQFAHIIFCFSTSYNKELLSNNPDKDFAIRKTVHEKATMEFIENGNRNFRFRCVLMPGTVGIETLWAKVTHTYEFPKHFQQLLKRLKEKRNTSRSNAKTGAEIDQAEEAESAYTK